ncbi:MAG: hypothetical protein IMY76_00745 [Chloroflexi bacterium]|nr:hypothetical protein [Chloroflexota bacterium]
MPKHVDHKGKYFTDIVTKESLYATIQTLTVRITGKVHVRVQQRLKDELNRDGQFIAVTDAVVTNSRGEVVYQSDFITVNRDHIVWLSPDAESENQFVEEVS